jgi:GNAT superfamily N-acetyltransferase
MPRQNGTSVCPGDRIGQSVRVDAEALVRSPEITDAQEIARTKNDSWRVGYRGLLPDSILDGLDDARSTTQWVQWLRDGYENAGLRAEVRVTTDAARQVVGVSAFGADRDLPNDANRGELWVLYVAPSHWGRGYGYALLRDAEEALATTGRRDLALWVLEGNDRARRFYERAGWRGDDGMKPFGDSGLYEVRYRKQV